MPELPEVENTIRGLQKKIVGLKITDFWTDLVKFKSVGKLVKNKKVVRVERRGKNILINLSEDKILFVHLKMTGHLLYGDYEKKGKGWVVKESGALADPTNRFLHAVFSLSNGKFLAFSDVRKFGVLKVLDGQKIWQMEYFKKLGPEPLEDNFIFKKFEAILEKKPKEVIKSFLLDQNNIAGVGNIYADEVLWASGVYPEERTQNITKAKRKAIFLAIKKILTKAVLCGGTSVSDYRNISGEKGGYEKYLKAYRLTGEKCQKKGCPGVIIRKKIKGRGTHFCSVHQRLVGN